MEGAVSVIKPGSDSAVELLQVSVLPVKEGTSMEVQAGRDAASGEFPGFKRISQLESGWKEDHYLDIFEFAGQDGTQLVGARAYWPLEEKYLKVVLISRPGRDKEALNLFDGVLKTLVAWENKYL